jgi:hypothetical protein
MRSIRTAALLAATALIAVALVVPAVASASNWKLNGAEIKKGLTWTQDGVTLEGGAGTLGLSGTMTLKSDELGDVSCPVSANVSLSPTSANGQLKEFSASISKCKLAGLMASLCGENGLTSFTLASQPVGVTANEAGGKKVISTPNEVTFAAQLGSCLSLSYKGKLTMTPNSSSAIGSVALSGVFGAYAPIEGKDELIAYADASGTLNASPSGKFGISDKRLLKVSGSIERISEFEGISCPVSGVISLDPESSAGQLVSLSNSGACAGTPSCLPGSLSIGSPWTLTDTGSAIQATNVSITGNCMGAGGAEMTMSVNSTTAISTASFDANLKSVFGGTQRYKGTLNWTPAGVYGL